MGSLFKPDVQDTTTKTELPPWMNQYGEWLTGSAQGMVDRPYTPYEGSLFSGFNPMQQAAMGTANYFGGLAPGALAGGYNALNDVTGANMMGNAYQGLGGFFNNIMNQAGSNPVNAMMVNPAQGRASTSQAMYGTADQAALGNRGDIRNVQGGNYLAGVDGNQIQDYMNPYTQGVMDNVFSDMNRVNLQQLEQQSARANAAGAFGGGREAVEKALIQSENQRNVGQMSNQLWNQAYNNATNLMGQDLNRGFQAGLSNQGMDWNMANLNAGLGLQNAMMNTDMSRFNAGLGTQNNQFNAGMLTNTSLQNAGMRNQVGLANAGNDLQAQLANMQNNQFGYGLGLNALNSMGNIGQAMGNFTQTQGRNLTDYGISGMGAQQRAGDQFQQYQDMQLQDQYRQWLEGRDWQANNFGQFGGMGLGAQGNTTTTGQAFGPSKGSQLMGAATGIAGIAACSIEYKDLESEVDVDKVLEQLEEMELYNWKYKGDDENHMGPIAEDFNEVLDKRSKVIQFVDMFGFLMAATKGLAQRVKQLESQRE